MMRVRVVWGLADTMATFCPSILFRSEDLPTLGQPTIATNAVFVSMYVWAIYASSSI